MEQLIKMADLPADFPTPQPEWPKGLKDKPVTAGAVTDIVAYTIAETVKPLMARIAALEARPHVRYLGVWKDGRTYSPGSMVSEDGGVWHCEKETTTRPGTTADWVLAVKRAAK